MLFDWFGRQREIVRPPNLQEMLESSVSQPVQVMHELPAVSVPIEEAIASYDRPPLRDRDILVITREVARYIIKIRKDAPVRPLLPDDVDAALRNWCASERVRRPSYGTFREYFKREPNVEKRRISTLDDDDHDFVFERMQARGKYVPRPVVYYIFPEKQTDTTRGDPMEVAWLSAAPRALPFEPREKLKARRGPKKKRKTPTRKAA
ncbi:MAG: hypothetical protein Q7T86_03250 [Hyphomicrobiaceae bacterium]|nr:hypothetical protein [Hyphomicrobiaceae bacterium]